MKPQAVKMTVKEFKRMVKKCGYALTETDTGFRATKKDSLAHSTIYADRCMYNDQKVSNFEVFTDLYNLKSNKLTYVLDLEYFLMNHMRDALIILPRIGV